MADKIGRLLIHGVGLIGGSLGMAVLQNGIAGEVIGIGRERDSAQLELAVRLGAISRYELSGQDGTGLYDACADVDVIALCTPVAAIARDLPGVLASASAGAAVMDVGSVKGPILAASGHDPRFVGSHPMTGSERAGVEAARADLFQGATWAIVPTAATSSTATERIRSLAAGIGAVPKLMTAESHDQAVALTSHLPHLLAYLLMALASERAESNPDLRCLAAGSFTSATRVAASLPSLWSEIAAQNKPALSEVLHAFRERLDTAQELLDSEDYDGLKAKFEDGFDARRSWTRHEK